MTIESPELDIRNKIRSNSKITFAEFMETALYHPKGYYNSSNNILLSGSQGIGKTIEANVENTRLSI